MPLTDFQVKDSGQRESYDSGMVRDTQEGKARFDLLVPLIAGMPFDEHMLTRAAMHMTKGAKKYGYRNWEKASSQEELDRFRASALRHMMQWMSGETDEDHAAAVIFNLIAAATTKWKIDHPPLPSLDTSRGSIASSVLSSSVAFRGPVVHSREG